MLNLEEMDEDDLVKLHANYLKLAGEARQALRKGGRDTGVPEVD